MQDMNRHDTRVAVFFLNNDCFRNVSEIIDLFTFSDAYRNGAHIRTPRTRNGADGRVFTVCLCPGPSRSGTVSGRPRLSPRPKKERGQEGPTRCQSLWASPASRVAGS